jgi:hypothetical protein
LLDGIAMDGDLGCPMVSATDESGERHYVSLFPLIDAAVGGQEVVSLDYDPNERLLYAIRFGNGKTLKPRCACCAGNLSADPAIEELVGCRLVRLGWIDKDDENPEGALLLGFERRDLSVEDISVHFTAVYGLGTVTL